MSYEQILARAPSSRAAGNKAAAAEYVVFLSACIADRGEFSQLTLSQQNYLYKLRDKWSARAAGTDTRWATHGSRPGPTTDPTKTKKTPSRRQRPDPGEQSPMFQSLMRKFGTPPSRD